MDIFQSMKCVLLQARRIFSDVNLQEGQDIFGVDFDYDEFEKYGDEYESESEGEDDYEDEGMDGDREKRHKKAAKKKTTKKSIFEIYEPSELKRGHFTDVDNEVNQTNDSIHFNCLLVLKYI